MSNSERVKQLATATLGYTSAALAASELVAKLTVDANEFINAEADAPIPDSIRQAVRLVNTPELEECAARVSGGIARGMAGAASVVLGGGYDGGGESTAGPSTAERLVDKLLDPRNWGVVSVVVGGATRQTLETIIDVWRESQANAAEARSGADGEDNAPSSSFEQALEKALHLAASDDGKSVLLDVCSTFVSGAVGTYLDKTAGSNTFDDFFAAALAASNREAFGDIAGRVTGEAVRTVVEAVSPAAAAVSRRAQQRRAAEEEERRGAVGENISNAEVTSSSRNRNLFGAPDSPRTVFAANSREHSPPSTAAGDSPDRSSVLTRRIPRSDSESAALATAAFTSALLTECTPRVFSAFTSPDGRRLVADVAGTCAASATRSLVLSVRDAVFFVDRRGGRKDGDEHSTYARINDLARFAFAVLFIAWITASLLSSFLAITQTIFGWQGGYANAGTVMEELSNIPETGGAKTGWCIGNVCGRVF